MLLVKYSVKVVYILCSLLFLIYIARPLQDFPSPPKNALQSNEPADTESSLRRSYFVQDGRSEVLSHYESFVKNERFMGLQNVVFRLNYPPEDAFSLIRDQTRSTFLEEIVVPYRSYLYVNGFEPKNEKDVIFIASEKWRQKITIKYIPTNLYIRLGIGLAIILLIKILSDVYLDTWTEFYRLINKNKKAMR